MLAVYCAACSKQLLDATSVETGMGPHCRKKYGLPDALDEDTRVEANRLVYLIACKQDDSDDVRDALDQLDALGCALIVARICKRLYGDPISAWLDGGLLVVKSPYSPSFLDACRGIRSRRWDRDRKATTFSPADYRDVAAAIIAGYNERARIFIGADEESLPVAAVGLSTGMFDELCDGYEAAPPPPTPPTPVKVVRDVKTGRCAIACPYDRVLVDAMKCVEGRRWDGGGKVNTFPLEAEEEVLGLIRLAFARLHVVTTDGQVAGPASGGRGRRGMPRMRSDGWSA